MDAGLKTHFVVSEGLELRAWREDDVQIAFDIVKRNSDHLEPFMRWMTPDYSLEAARTFIIDSITNRLQKKDLRLAIFRDSNLIGTIGFVSFDLDAKKTEIGYWIDKEEEGKGIITRACRVLIDYAFNELELNRIEIRCSAKNSRSAAVPERLGFTKEAVLRQSERLKDGLHDFSVYSLLAQDTRLW
jgi:ribosomal-protein-serine acetyltransferase